MDFYTKWAADLKDTSYMNSYLSKSEESRKVFRYGTEEEVKYACDILRKIPLEDFLDGIQHIDASRLPRTDEIPQCGTLEKAICEVPTALAFAENGLICEELGLRLGASNGGDAPRKSGEGNGKMAVSMDIALRLKLTIGTTGKKKYGYKISPLGHYLLRFPELKDKMDIISRLLLREYIAQVLIAKAIGGYVSYPEVTASLKSTVTRMRRRQNVRRIITLIDEEHDNDVKYYDLIDWDIEE